MTTNFAMPNTSSIDYEMGSSCLTDSLSITFSLMELKMNFANMTLHFKTHQNDVNSTKYWAMTSARMDYM